MGQSLSKSLATKHYSTEDELRDSEARYRRLFEAAQDGILILDGHTGLITDVNPFLTNLLDNPREEFIGRALWDFGPFRNVGASKAAFDELQDKEYIRYEDLPLEARGGRRVNVEFVSNVYGVNGNRVIQCNIRDISARKRAEQVGERCRQSQKMEAIGQLAGGVSHDFNNLLGVILGYCELLEERVDPADPKRKMVEEIHNAGTRATALTRQLLAFSRRQVLHPVVLDLNRLVAAMETMLRRLIGDNIEITTSLLPGLGRVKADPTQIEQILINLAVNSRDAMARGGTISIETTNVELNDNFVVRHPDVKPGSYVLLSLHDSGVGMDSQTQAHIFEPFFTTKKPGKGTGLGLSTVYGIVKQSGGHIEAESELGSGTTFRVYLPRVKDEAKAPTLVKALSPVGGGETLLLVEDSAPLRELMQEMLGGLGYNILAFGRPLEAIRTVERYPGPIALLVTDVVMPEINGRELAETLVRSRPEMKVLYTSGYAGDTCVEQGELEAGSPLMEKPFTRDTLARRVRELLDSAQ